MHDLPPDARSPDETDETDDEEGTPRWVYAFGILIAVIAVGFVTLHLLGGGFPAHTLP